MMTEQDKTVNITLALDDATTLRDLLVVIALAGEGIGDASGGAIARTTMIALDYLDNICGALRGA